MHVLNRMEMSNDGKTDYEGCKGKRAKVLCLVFGEKVLWKHRRVGTLRTARRIPEEETWHVDNLEWVQMVRRNTGAEDADADGELPEFEGQG